MGYGQGSAALLIMALILSTAFLMWVGDKKENPHRRAGTIIAIIAIVLSSLFIVGKAYRCISMYCGKCYDRPMMKKMYMPKGLELGMGMRNGRGMGRGMKTPPPPPPAN